MTARKTGAGLIAAAALAVLAACGSGSSGSEPPAYQVTVGFTEEVTQGDMDSVADFLRGYDEYLDFLVREIFPPIGSARVATDVEGFCDTVVADVEARSYVREASCEPYEAPDGGDPDEPVSNQADDSPY